MERAWFTRSSAHGVDASSVVERWCVEGGERFADLKDGAIFTLNDQELGVELAELGSCDVTASFGWLELEWIEGRELAESSCLHGLGGEGLAVSQNLDVNRTRSRPGEHRELV